MTERCRTLVNARPGLFSKESTMARAQPMSLPGEERASTSPGSLPGSSTTRAGRWAEDRRAPDGRLSSVTDHRGTSHGGTLQVLLVDDDQDLCAMMGEYLGAHGCSVRV